MTERIGNSEDARAALARWQGRSAPVLASLIRQAIEGLELDQMYYEQKDNTAGVDRCQEAILVLRGAL